MSDISSSEDQLQTVGQLLQYCSEQLEHADVFFGHGTDNAWDEAVQMVLSVVGLPLDSTDGVLPHPVGSDDLARLQKLLERRITEQIPLPYLLGRAWFAGLEFYCDERAIIPRSPIAELILNEFQPWYTGPAPRRVLDLCCGGGAIGLACAYYFPDFHVDLLDVDPGALDLARENVNLLKLEERVTLLESDLVQALGDVKYDLILSNPPYVDAASLAAMPAEFLREPELALGSGLDGLDLTRTLLSTVGSYLRDSGILVLEVGNSWPALERCYPRLPFTWIEFEHGGEGVLTLTASELQEYSPQWDE
jgi:ribosomal protein L3 glutamine methyltransferase